MKKINALLKTVGGEQGSSKKKREMVVSYAWHAPGSTDYPVHHGLYDPKQKSPFHLFAYRKYDTNEPRNYLALSQLRWLAWVEECKKNKQPVMSLQ